MQEATRLARNVCKKVDRQSGPQEEYEEQKRNQVKYGRHWTPTRKRRNPFQSQGNMDRMAGQNVRDGPRILRSFSFGGLLFPLS